MAINTPGETNNRLSVRVRGRSLDDMKETVPYGLEKARCTGPGF